MDNEQKLKEEYIKVIENLPSYKGDFDDPVMVDWYQRGFEEWKRSQKEFRYYNYMIANT